MIIDVLNDNLEKKGFHRVKVNANNIYLHYQNREDGLYIVTILDCSNGKTFTAEQYSHIRNQIHTKFMNQRPEMVRQLSILCTGNMEYARSVINNDNDQWIINTEKHNLVLFENQNGNFLDLREAIENMLVKQTSDIYESKESVSNLENSALEPEASGTKRILVRKHISKCNLAIVIVNVLIFCVFDFISARKDTNDLFDAGALYWPSILHLHQYYRLFTYMFLHSGIEHIANNMIVLFFIGDNLERAAGTIKYMIVYFASGIIAGIASVSYNMLTNTNAVSVGASGAIFGVVGAMAYIVIINKGKIENISSVQMLLFVLLSLYGGLTSQGVDNAAHIGGLAAGIVLAAILYRKQEKPQVEGN
jgi:rhomboid protease GluP